MKAPVPAKESERLEALRRYGILDTLPERDFDDLTSLAASICGTPMALVTLVDADRQWFKAKVGVQAAETSRDAAFCAHAILQSDLLIVSDASADPRFADNPLVVGPPHIRFYAGAPLITPDGHALGTLCVVDLVPHELTPAQAQSLGALGRQVVAQLELRKARADLESALQQSEERWRAVFDKSAIGVALSEETGHFLAVNRAYEKMLGYTEEELRKLTLFDITPEEFREAYRTLLTEMWAGNRQQYELEKPYRRKDGSLIWVRLHASLVPGSDSVPRLALALCEDITEWKLAEEARRESEQRFRTLLEHAPEAIVVLDVETLRFVDVNENAVKLLGLNAEQLMKVRPMDISAPVQADGCPVKESAAEKIEQAVNGGMPVFEWVYRNASGQDIPCEVRLVRLPSADRVLIRGSITDIRERKRAEEALREAETRLSQVTRFSTMGELAASIAHEVNQPLAAIVNNGSACLRMLSGESPDLHEVREAVTDIIRDGKRASEVIAGIRGLFKKHRAQKALVAINDIVAEALFLIRGTVERHRVLLHSNLASGLPPVLGDRVQLQQVVLNLIANGIDAMSSIAGRPRELRIASERQGAKSLVVSVCDSGVGFDPEHVDRFFDALYTTKPGGIGMGLSISRSIIEAHGGRLWGELNDGPGATFQFSLPVEMRNSP